jgi:hypothetical protein
MRLVLDNLFILDIFWPELAIFRRIYFLPTLWLPFMLVKMYPKDGQLAETYEG